MKRITTLCVAATLRVAAGCAMFACAGVHAQESPEKFYAGKTVRILVGYPPGSTFDTYARVTGKHMAKHIPGQPTLVIQNMPGAGGLNAIATAANLGPFDGTTMALSNPQSTTAPLLDPASAKYDPRKFNWVGSVASETSACAFVADRVKNVDDMRGRELILGATGASGGSAMEGRVLQAILGFKFKIVTGYPGMVEVRLAAEKGEVDGQCGLPGSTIKTDLWDQWKSGKIAIPFQAGLIDNPDLVGIPNAYQWVKSEEDRQVFRLVYGPLTYMRPIMLPDNVPADRVAALRAAFDATMKDAAFLDEMQKIRLDVRPLSGEKLGELVGQLYATPAAVIERTKGFVNPEVK